VYLVIIFIQKFFPKFLNPLNAIFIFFLKSSLEPENHLFAPHSKVGTFMDFDVKIDKQFTRLVMFHMDPCTHENTHALQD
jgi:hypothetical protein